MYTTYNVVYNFLMNNTSIRYLEMLQFLPIFPAKRSLPEIQDHLKAYDYLNQNEQEQGSKVNKQLTKRRLALKDETPDMIKEGILKKQFY